MKKLFVIVLIAFLSSCAQFGMNGDDIMVMSHKVKNSKLSELCKMLRSDNKDPRVLDLLLSEFNQRNVSYVYCYTHGSGNLQHLGPVKNTYQYVSLDKSW